MTPEAEGMPIPETMCAVVLTGYGGLERLEYRTDLPVPRVDPGWVLVRVTAAGMNNTDINTRTGWYNQEVGDGTTAEGGAGGFGVSAGGMGDWAGDIRFPRIQGADCVGRIVAVGDGVDAGRIGERIVGMPYIHEPDDPDWFENAGFLGAEYDGAFAQFAALPSRNAVAIPDDAPFTDAQIATLPCSGGTAMNMMRLAGLAKGDLVLVTGASGGVGTFLVQIARHAGATVIGVCGTGKAREVLAIGADATVDRDARDLVAAASAAAGGRRFTLIADVVGGERFSEYLSLLRRGGRYVTAGAVSGPHVGLDLRTLYLKSLSFFGSTVYLQDTFPALIGTLLEGGLKPAVAQEWPLRDIRRAQERFLSRAHVGSMVLIPPQAGQGG